MSEILKLVKMDLIVIKNKSVLPLVFFAAIYIFLGYLIIPYAVLVPVMFVGLTLQPLFTIDEQNDLSRLYGSLPVSRRNRAIARFMTVAVFTAIALVITIMLAYHSAEVGWYKEYNKEMAEVYAYWSKEITIPILACFIYMLTCLMVGIQFTLLYIFGASKEIVAIIGAFVIIIGGMLAVTLVFDIDIVDKIAEVLGNLMAKSEMLFYIVLYSGSVLFLLLCALISSIFIKKREI